MHYHCGTGMQGYGLDEGSDVCETLSCLASCVHHGLAYSSESLADDLANARSHADRMLAALPTHPSYPTTDQLQTALDAAWKVLQTLDLADSIDTLLMSISPTRRQAPLYRDDVAAWEAMIGGVLVGTAGPTAWLDVDERTFYGINMCDTWECLVSEFDESGMVITGGYTACVCRDCMAESFVFDPLTGGYCQDCWEACCRHRDRVECDRSDDSQM